jgi:hypothetical protein
VLIGIISLFGISYSAGWHVAEEILSGEFKENYNFSKEVNFKGNVSFTGEKKAFTRKLIYTTSSSIGTNGWRDLDTGKLRNKLLFVELDWTTKDLSNGYYGNCVGFYKFFHHTDGIGEKTILNFDSHTNGIVNEPTKRLDMIRIKATRSIGNNPNLIFSIYPKSYTLKIYEVE